MKNYSDRFVAAFLERADMAVLRLAEEAMDALELNHDETLVSGQFGPVAAG